MKQDISLPRNPVLVKLFRCAKLAENAGYGFDKMLSWKKETNREVLFDSDIIGSTVTFMLKNEIQPQESGGQIGGQIVYKNNNNQKNSIKLSETQYLIIEEIRKNPKISRKELSGILSMNPSAIQKHLNKLQEMSMIARKGKTRSAIWLIRRRLENL